MNAFADHFLTDAFAAGHLFNKDDAMAQFNARLAGGGGFFNNVAKEVWADKAVAAYVSQYETVEYKGVVFRPNINSAGRFAALLKGVQKAEPEVLAGTVAKVIHDNLNALAKDPNQGVEVENRAGDKWKLSGDGSLNGDSLKVGQKAVAQSQKNVLDVLAMGRMPKVKELDAMAKAVWDYAPAPTSSGLKTLKQHLALNDPANKQTVSEVARLIRKNIRLIIGQLVARKKLKKA